VSGEVPVRARRAFAAAALAASIALANAFAQAPNPAVSAREERPEDLPEGPGREETFYLCSACHSFRLVAAQGMTRAQWNDSLSWMTTRHNMADVQGADRELVLDYLSTHYPPRVAPRGGWRNPFAPQ
jgi:hypothetical protein